MKNAHECIRSFVIVVAIGAVTPPAQAVDGVTLIDQNKVMAGNVTPGDLPGFPLTISQAGSYRLAGNLTVPNANTNGIEILAQNVSIDLNGFAITGPITCSEFPSIACSTSGTGVGIASFVFANVMLRNGFIQGMGKDGIFMLSGIVESVQVNQNAGNGMNIASGIVRDSIARDNGQAGISLGSGSASRNAFNHNPVGLVTTTGTSYSGNTFSFNLSNVTGAGINTGQNVCENAICPGAQY